MDAKNKRIFEQIVQFENGQRNATFSFFDYNNNNSKDYIFSYGNTVKVVDSDKKELYKNEFEKNITQIPLIFKMSDKSTRLGLVTENQIYLINAQSRQVSHTQFFLFFMLHHFLN